MIDWEGMILDRQEQIEHLLDECDGECERCAFSEPIQVGTYSDGTPRYATTGLGGEIILRCGLVEEKNNLEWTLKQPLKEDKER